MSFKPLPIKKFKKCIDGVNWVLKKGGIDWNLYDNNDNFICSIIVSHGKSTKTAFSVHKTKKSF